MARKTLNERKIKMRRDEKPYWGPKGGFQKV